MSGPRALYAAFDRVPTAKGASIHIAHMARAMQQAFGETLLACVSGGVLPAREREGTLEVRRLAAGHAHLVDRVAAWQAELGALVATHAETLETCHFRDPWSGLPILDARGGFRTVFEVNGLPSIEMPERYPAISARTLEKIRAMELRCLHGAERILVPAQALALNLARLGVDAAKIAVVPNGADLPAPAPRPAEAPPRYVLYFGALQAWQGVGVAIAAMARLVDTDLALVICSSHPPRVGHALKARAERLGIADRILWRHELPRDELAAWVRHAVATLAPIAETPRNLEQGCCPLKVLESMAAGTPVIASDLAPVRELVSHGEHGLLVRPGRPELLARAIRRLDDDPVLRERLGRAAEARVRSHYRWDEIESRVARWYLEPPARRAALGGSR